MTSINSQKPRRFKALHLLPLFLLVGGFFLGCTDDDDIQPRPPSTSINKILPLGASRVEGARPAFESYRYELWKLLVDGGWDFDYVGTQQDAAAYDGLPDLPFDPDHEGRGGWTSRQIRNGINEWVQAAGAPDIVLFSSPGGNDALSGSATISEIVENVNAIIDDLQAANPNVTIVIEQLAPGKSDFMTPALTAYFMSINQQVVSIATEQTTTTSTVLVVDMSTGFNDGLLADDVHYNEAGGKFIADRYYAVLRDILRR